MAQTYRFYYHSPIGILYLEADEQAVTALHRVEEALEHTGPENAVLQQAKKELKEYFQGKRTAFEVPVRFAGTEFQKKVWSALCEIPYGETRSYLDIAMAIGAPKACRAVGGANHRNPVMLMVPCHRVIGSQGDLVGFGGGMEAKQYLLQLEQRVWLDRKIKAAIFDMDGVIFDSERAIFSEWKQLARIYHLKNIEAVYDKTIGVNAAMAQQIFTEHYPDMDYTALKGEVSRAFHDKYDGGRLPIKTGVRELLSYLKERGILIGLASSTRYPVVLQELKEAGLVDYFDAIVGGDMVAKSKPEPDIYLKACELLGIAPQNAIAIEDSYNGIRSASSAGMYPVMVPDMKQPDGEIKRLCKAVLADLLAVKDWIQTGKM